MTLDDLISQFSELGLQCTAIERFGDLVRCKADGDKGKAKSGWYLVFENFRHDGSVFYTGVVGNFRLGEKRNLKPQGIRLSPEEQQALKKQRREAEAQRKRQQKWDADKAAQVEAQTGALLLGAVTGITMGLQERLDVALEIRRIRLSAEGRSG